MTTTNLKLQVDCEAQQAEMEKRKEVENRWRNRCNELEVEIDKLKKEAQDFYSADRFDNQYD